MNFRDWLKTDTPDAGAVRALLARDTDAAIYVALRKAYDAGRLVEAESAALRAHAALNAPLGSVPQ